ncbi:ElyC/SanA/YdcF family protein [Angustibacter sp. McL0619]|uniref:ElyC/SanA/YdcF family protein n=1 Tax=Angustibacter sp. McL0619 TaxID=3415676 RepID=UPI003CF0BAB6
MPSDSGTHELATALNLIDRFVAVRDVPTLTGAGLAPVLGSEQADLLMLFGACPPGGWETAVAAVRGGAAARLMLIGGIGHTTEHLWGAMCERFPGREFAGRPEADIMAEFLSEVHGLDDVLTERRSTNCGNNISLAQDVVRQAGLAPRSVILVQDRTMQRRMSAGFGRLWTLGQPTLVSFAAYEQEFTVVDGRLAHLQDVWGSWSVPRYVSLLLGEVERLTDSPEGYGPQGRDYIAHVDVPAQVQDAAALVARATGTSGRVADARYGSEV